jgi:tripeptide aminopeptidase
MSVTEKFLRYVAVETTAGEEKSDAVSNPKILDLSELLLQELQAFHPSEISFNRYGILDAKFDGEGEKARVAFLAHMDTSPQASGKDVRVTRTVYEGKPIPLGNGLVLDAKEFPSLDHEVGHRILHTDGRTLLGGDDKAGIAIVLEAFEELRKEGAKTRPLEILFTTDEEIGADAGHISLENVDSTYGYTVDGGDARAVSVETFTAVGMKAEAKGKSIHPGYAKDRLVSAANLLIRFQNDLPEALRPEETEGREPFYHLCTIEGSEDHAKADYILRSFDENEMKSLVGLAKLTAHRINDHVGYEAITLQFRDEYHNMKEALEGHPEILKEMEEAYRLLSLPMVYYPVRGGTTGSQLSFRGLPCPNLGTGDYNCHGRFEYVDEDEMEAMVGVVKALMKA